MTDFALRSDDDPYSIGQLRDCLNRLPAGAVNRDHASAILELVNAARDDFRGGAPRGRQLILLAQVDLIRWNPPVLGILLWYWGAYYDELQHWDHNLDTRRRTITKVERRPRQGAVPPQAAVDTTPIADELARLIFLRTRDPRLQWSKEGKVRVRIQRVLPEASSRTTHGRRQRLVP